MSLLDDFKKQHIKTDLPEFRPGYTVRVHQKIKEKKKKRIQIFEGIVIARKGGNSLDATFTVRKVTSGVGVERIFPLHSPHIAQIEVVKKAQPRRAKLYYLRRKQRERMRKEERVKEEKQAEKKEEPKIKKDKNKKQEKTKDKAKDKN